MPSPATIVPRSRADWRRWLRQHHRTSKGIWIVYYKKNSGKQKLAYEEAVEEALCFGWIDGKTRTVDADRYRQLFTPRRPRSVWAASNKRRVARLKRLGLMMPAGLEAVRTAKQNGSWSSLTGVDVLSVPEDLRTALARRPALLTGFTSLRPSLKKILLHWIGTAKRPDTRRRRIRGVVAMTADRLRTSTRTSRR